MVNSHRRFGGDGCLRLQDSCSPTTVNFLRYLGMLAACQSTRCHIPDNLYIEKYIYYQTNVQRAG